jgi:hypothetical protein
MTEEEWLAGTHPGAMLRHLEPTASERKLRLFVCACGRMIWHLIEEGPCQIAVETAEGQADGMVSDDAVDTVLDSLDLAREQRGRNVVESLAARAAEHALTANKEDGSWTFDSAWEYAASALDGEHLRQEGLDEDALNHWADQAVEADFREFSDADIQGPIRTLLRDILGNPFRPVTIDPALLTWRDATIPKLAQAAYDERELPSGHLDVKRLAILADALEEAGCTNEDVLSHLRGPGPHVRGCWVVDLLLGKE